MRLATVLRLGAAAMAMATAAACGSSGTSGSVADRASATGKLTIGIKLDQPGLSTRKLGGGFEGFDIDVATYVAKELGVNANGITWREAPPSDREKLIQNGDVDMVVATYSITDKRKQQVSFAGPYFIAGQGLLVRSTTNDITGPSSLNGKRLCSVLGTTSAQQVRNTSAPQAQLLEYPRYSDCVTALLNEQVDAVTTDDVILAGYAAQNPELLKLVGKPFSTERYGIGLKKGDTSTQQKIDIAINKMVNSGSWLRSLEKYMGPSRYEIPGPPTISEK